MSVDEEEYTWDDYHELGRALSEKMGEWAGVPLPLEGHRLVVEDRYPWKGIEELNVRTFVASDTDVSLGTIKNSWYSRSRGGYVMVYERNGQSRVLINPRYRYAERLTFWLTTIGASRAWDLGAEVEALGKLESLITPYLFNMYLLTGSFLETSPRSQVTYLFRKARPTLALAPTRRGNEDSSMKCLAVLCLHPIAYYADSWAGAMVPTDDVIAHLLLCRADEAKFWARANQHDPESPQAGI